MGVCIYILWVLRFGGLGVKGLGIFYPNNRESNGKEIM